LIVKGKAEKLGTDYIKVLMCVCMCISGGAVRFSKQIWDFESVQDRGSVQAAVFRYYSKDGEAVSVVQVCPVIVTVATGKRKYKGRRALS
jgi:hypothetical protein